MTQAAEEILQKALELPEEDRDRIADSLWRSVHGAGSETIAKEWNDEIERRIAEVDAEKVRLEPWDETMAELKARYSR
jgi:putative addiction module component (TIGR02574 family)